MYHRGDLVVLAVARNLVELRLDLEVSFQIANHASKHVDAFRDPKAPASWRRHRWLAGWPVHDGREGERSLPGPFALMFFDDLNRLIQRGGPKAVLVDLEKMARDLPDTLWEVLGYAR